MDDFYLILILSSTPLRYGFILHLSNVDREELENLPLDCERQRKDMGGRKISAPSGSGMRNGDTKGEDDLFQHAQAKGQRYRRANVSLRNLLFSEKSIATGGHLAILKRQRMKRAPMKQGQCRPKRRIHSGCIDRMVPDHLT